MSTFPTRIGPYRILELLGQGAFSRVYRASLSLLGNQEYALKILRERCKPREVQTLLGECSKVKLLGTHPHLVQFYFAGWDQRLKRYYVVMELIQGSNAQQLVDESPLRQLSLEQALSIAVQVAIGLEHAHARGVLHLDVKPSNILVQRDHLVAKLADFGNAQLCEAKRGFARLPALGTSPYQPWELTPQGYRAGRRLDARSDVYELAVTLYYLLTGHLPHRNTEGLPAFPVGSWPDFPPSLEELLLGALSRDPDARPATMNMFRRALEAVRSPYPRQPRHAAVYTVL